MQQIMQQEDQQQNYYLNHIINTYGQSDKYQAKAESSTGYKVSWDKGNTWANYIQKSSDYLKTEKPYVIKEKTNANDMWVASPNSPNVSVVKNLFVVSCSGFVTGQTTDMASANTYCGFRPLVCLKSDIHLEKSEDGNSYVIVE